MTFRKALHLTFFSGMLLLLLPSGAGCLKEEYSYERTPVAPRDTATVIDTTVIIDTPITIDTTLVFPPCNVCKHATSLSTGQWNFKYDTSFLCGTVTNVVMTPDKTAFTFFGPSSCTVGTGLIITASFDQLSLDRDLAGVMSRQVTMQYYNNNGGKDIFISGPGTKFSITINQFDSRTGVAIGQFNGTVLTANDQLATITAGNFKIQFP
jgi:hypothetical protein